MLMERLTLDRAALCHFRKLPQLYAEPALRQRTGITGRAPRVRKVLHRSRKALKVGFQFRQRAALPILGLSQQGPALAGSEGCGLPV